MEQRSDQSEVIASIYAFPLPASQGDETQLVQSIVLSYMVHNGLSRSAEAFARCTGQRIKEDLSSIRNRQKIVKLVMSGQIGRAMELTSRAYPRVLENNKNLLFMLKCRRFVELINGSDVLELEVDQANFELMTNLRSQANDPNISADSEAHKQQKNPASSVCSFDMSQTSTAVPVDSKNNLNDDINNRNSCRIHSKFDFLEADFDRILAFGKDIMQLGQQLENENLLSDDERHMMADAFSLIAYSNPWASPLRWQFSVSKREVISSVLNSAILGSLNYSWRPPLEICIAHASELLKFMSQIRDEANSLVNINDML